MEETKGVIYILTNPSFPQYVKIGYADDVDKRLAQLNRSECIPFAFRCYATYQVESRLSDKKIHEIIDKLNPNLRAVENFNGKKRVREFYAMSKEDAYSILEAIAEIHGRTSMLTKIKASDEEKKDEATAEEIDLESDVRRGNAPITLEEYLKNKNPQLVSLFNKIYKQVMDIFPDTEIYVLPQYIGFRKDGTYYADINIQRNAIRIMTMTPDNRYSIGNKIPDSFLWTMKYRTYINSEDQLSEIIEIIKESYNKR